MISPASKRARARERYNERLRNRFKKPIPRVIVPSFFTLMNLFCGFLAIIQISEGQLQYGAWLIVLAGVFDALDGFMARITNSTSAFGIELDSLSDVVSFGVAPGFLLYSFGLNNLQIPGVILAALPAVCGAIRLARFNVDAKVQNFNYFKGLPIPVQAIMIVGFYLSFRNNLDVFDTMQYGMNTVLIPMVILLSLLMVSTVPFDKVPRVEKGKVRKSRNKILLFFAYFLVIVVLQEWGLMIAFSVFIAKGLYTFLIQYWRELLADDPAESQS
ncbi:MAG: CDP-diacylglycerol--serine O-phosphatidyltransferase [Balneolales bacterium]|nr:CDP-diacylglycerol--serine O-phosphatidyltransferase [Balneolales bacterium]